MSYLCALTLTSYAGFQVCAHSIDLRAGNFAELWCHNDSVADAGLIGPVTYSTTDGMILAWVSGTKSAFLWALNATDGKSVRLSPTTDSTMLPVASQIPN